VAGGFSSFVWAVLLYGFGERVIGDCVGRSFHSRESGYDRKCFWIFRCWDKEGYCWICWPCVKEGYRDPLLLR